METKSPGIVWLRLRQWSDYLLILLLITAGDLACRAAGRAFLFSPWAASGDISLSEELFWVADRQPDVVLIGDSRTGTGLKPLSIERVLKDHGIDANVVSIWLAGAGLVEARQIIDRLVLRYPPKLVVLNINENRLVFPSPPADSLRWDEAMVQKWPQLAMLSDDVDWRLRQISGALRWGAFIKRASYNAFFDFAKGVFLHDKIPSGGLAQRKGYLPRFGRQRSAQLEYQEAVNRLRYSTYEPTPIGVQQLRELLARTQARGMHVVAMIMPVPPDLFAKFPPERYAAFVRTVEQETKAQGIPLMNYYQDRDLPLDGYFDYQHMNDVGAEAFSSQLAREVVAPALRNWEAFKAARFQPRP